MTTLYPEVATPFSSANSLVTAKSRGISNPSASSMLFKDSMCFFGIIKIWQGALGLISSKARHNASSRKILAGRVFWTIRQKMQCDIVDSPPTKKFRFFGRRRPLEFRNNLPAPSRRAIRDQTGGSLCAPCCNRFQESGALAPLRERELEGSDGHR